ncbi:unnamed protein product, partial [marine sediment metagenome]
MSGTLDKDQLALLLLLQQAQNAPGGAAPAPINLQAIIARARTSFNLDLTNTLNSFGASFGPAIMQAIIRKYNLPAQQYVAPAQAAPVILGSGMPQQESLREEEKTAAEAADKSDESETTPAQRAG